MTGKLDVRHLAPADPLAAHGTAGEAPSDAAEDDQIPVDGEPELVDETADE